MLPIIEILFVCVQGVRLEALPWGGLVGPKGSTLRQNTAGRSARSAAFLVGAMPSTSRNIQSAFQHGARSAQRLPWVALWVNVVGVGGPTTWRSPARRRLE
jgi:hypothetical protein